MSDVFDELEELADAGDLEELERRAHKAAARAAGEDRVDLLRYLAWARLELGRNAEALAAAREAGDALLEGKALFHLWDFEGARKALARFSGEGEEEAEAEWYRGLVEEFTGGDASRHYRRAARLAPDLYAEPPRLSDAEADRVLRRAIEGLPPPVRRAVEEAVITVLPLPPKRPDVDPLTLGLYVGVSRLDRSHDLSANLPPRIEIYRRNVERIAENRDEAVEELRITLLHEIGHHLGFDEEGVAGLGLA
jgi:predicted Zn-dependent protease with MMP-like domain